MDKEVLDVLKSIQSETAGLKTDIKDLKTDVSGLKADVSDLKTDVTGLKTDVSDLKNGQNRIEKKLDAVYDQTPDLTELRIEMKDFKSKTYDELDDIKDNLNNVEVITASNWKDISKIKAVK